MKNAVLALQLAPQIRKNNPDMNQSQALSKAWAMVKNNEAKRLTFEKKDGSKTTRIVTEQVSQFLPNTGTGRPLKEGQRLFADLAKVGAGVKNPIISTYTQSIIAYA